MTIMTTNNDDDNDDDNDDNDDDDDDNDDDTPFCSSLLARQDWALGFGPRYTFP